MKFIAGEDNGPSATAESAVEYGGLQRLGVHYAGGVRSNNIRRCQDHQGGEIARLRIIVAEHLACSNGYRTDVMPP